jgi:hypothetical protein
LDGQYLGGDKMSILSALSICSKNCRKVERNEAFVGETGSVIYVKCGKAYGSFFEEGWKFLNQ